MVRERDSRGRYASKPTGEEEEEVTFKEKGIEASKERRGTHSPNMDNQSYEEMMNRVLAANREAMMTANRELLQEVLKQPRPPPEGEGGALAPLPPIGGGSFTLKPSEVHAFKPTS